MTLSAAIMAHPRREKFVDQLQQKLDSEVPVVWDRRNDRWDTGTRSMKAHDPLATHHVIIQDDAVIPGDFLAGVQACLEALPAEADMSPLCLYIGKSGRYRHLIQQVDERVSWLTMPTLNWGVSVVFPVELIADAIQWGNRRPDVPNWDKRLSRFFGSWRIPIWHTWPSLVDHRESPSLVPGRGFRGRRAQVFLGAEKSALDVKWSGEVVKVEPFGTGRVRIRSNDNTVRRASRGRAIRQRYGTPRPSRPGRPSNGGPRG